MAANIKIYIDPSAEETTTDSLSSDQISIEAGPAVRYMRPGKQTMIKLTVKNFSSVGRMVKVSAVFEGGKVGINFPTDIVYVAPQGSTATYAIVRSYAAVGPTNIKFIAV